MFNSKIIRDIRKELNISQADLYKDLLSRTSYYKFEKGEKEISIEQLAIICERLGMRPSELLYRTDFTRPASLPFWKEKLNLPNLTADKKQYAAKLNSLKERRFKSNVDYSLYIVLYAMGMVTNNIEKSVPSKKHLRSLEKLYKNRTEFYAIDYEILANLSVFIPNIDLNFLTEKMLPVNQSFGESFDFSVQIAIKNLISTFIHSKDFNKCDELFESFYLLRTIENFNINTSINLEIVYLEHLRNFLQKRNINDYIEATKIVELFLKLGYTQTHRLLVEEMREIALNENFQLPKELAFHIQAYETRDSNAKPDT